MSFYSDFDNIKIFFPGKYIIRIYLTCKMQERLQISHPFSKKEIINLINRLSDQFEYKMLELTEIDGIILDETITTSDMLSKYTWDTLSKKNSNWLYQLQKKLLFNVVQPALSKAMKSTEFQDLNSRVVQIKKVIYNDCIYQ